MHLPKLEKCLPALAPPLRRSFTSCVRDTGRRRLRSRWRRRPDRPASRAQSGDETIIRKGLPNAFAGTTLHYKLQELESKNLIFVGFMTHMCVSASVRAALDLGYRSTLVSGAAATRDLPTPSGGVIDAASLHDASLAAIADRFAIIVKSADQLPD